MLTHMSIIHAVMIYEACMGLTQAERSVVSVPLSHVTGLTAGLALMMRVAGTLIVMPTFKAEAFLELAARERMTHTVMVPAMYSLCLMQPQMDRLDFGAWRIGGFGGAPMPEVTIRELAGKLPGLRLFNAYGSTETTGPVVLMPPDQMAARRAWGLRARSHCRWAGQAGDPAQGGSARVALDAAGGCASARRQASRQVIAWRGAAGRCLIWRCLIQRQVRAAPSHCGRSCRSRVLVRTPRWPHPSALASAFAVWCGKNRAVGACAPTCV